MLSLRPHYGKNNTKKKNGNTKNNGSNDDNVRFLPTKTMTVIMEELSLITMIRVIKLTYRLIDL